MPLRNFAAVLLALLAGTLDCTGARAATMTDPTPPQSASSAPVARVSGSALAVAYTWREGSLPPPHHYWFTITAATDGEGRIVFVPGYPFQEPPRWEERFTPVPGAAAALLDLVRSRQLMTHAWRAAPDDAVGGSRRSFRLQQGERTVELPARLTTADAALAADLEKAIRGLVPETLWQSLRARHADYVKTCCR